MLRDARRGGDKSKDKQTEDISDHISANVVISSDFTRSCSLSRLSFSFHFFFCASYCQICPPFAIPPYLLELPPDNSFPFFTSAVSVFIVVTPRLLPPTISDLEHYTMSFVIQIVSIFCINAN